VMGHHKKGKKKGFVGHNKEVELNAIDMALVMPDVSFAGSLFRTRSRQVLN
jgi:hypothetical protein